jgi:hypothetical protein
MRELTENAASPDFLTRTHTAFRSFDELLNAPGGYFPSLNVGKTGIKLLADHYDHAQAARGDSRRAFRWGQRRRKNEAFIQIQVIA